MEEFAAAGQVVGGILGSIVSWGAIIIIIWMLRGFVIEAGSMALANLILDADEEMQKRLIRLFVKKRITLRQLYNEMKAEDEEKERAREAAQGG